MKKGQYIVERTNPYKNFQQFWNGATWVDSRNIAIPYPDSEARKLLNRFNKQEQFEFVFRLEQVKS